MTTSMTIRNNPLMYAEVFEDPGGYNLRTMMDQVQLHLALLIFDRIGLEPCMSARS